jgi:hypothetical protein
MNDTAPVTVTSVNISGHKTVYAVWGYDEDGNGIPDVLEPTRTYHIEHITEGPKGVYETVYSTQTLTADVGDFVAGLPITIAGFTFNPYESTGTISAFVPQSGTLTLQLFYDDNTLTPPRSGYTVTYAFGDDGNTVLVDDNSGAFYNSGDMVFVWSANGATRDGYEFLCWRNLTTGQLLAPGGPFIMPAKDVVIEGVWKTAGSPETIYTTIIYHQNGAGTGYDYYFGWANFSSVSGYTVTLPNPGLQFVYPGYHYNAAISTSSGTVVSDGSLVLRLYFDRDVLDPVAELHRVLVTAIVVDADMNVTLDWDVTAFESVILEDTQIHFTETLASESSPLWIDLREATRLRDFNGDVDIGVVPLGLVGGKVIHSATIPAGYVSALRTARVGSDLPHAFFYVVVNGVLKD